jgi:hypothetical protein
LSSTGQIALVEHPERSHDLENDHADGVSHDIVQLPRDPCAFGRDRGSRIVLPLALQLIGMLREGFDRPRTVTQGLP